ncbi:NUDIX domain-containing protein [Brachybacterium sp. YJGR34]|uniref:NUDIX domain-containing protein n=1 Tax=Brachybacterium sp. YJGR34 TaxID=2059911 RepID=UPI000E0A813D|nr:NUDIX domain-containing protein [Brachybacterium sp. YJGR34]
MRTPRLGVKALIIRDQRVLMNRYLDPDGREVFALPGGGQEHGEDQVSAMIRECREEIGARVEVHQVACLFEVMMETRMVDGSPIPPFHQVNVAYWCGLAEGEEPGEGTEPDPGQAGTAWLPLGRLAEHRIHPPELALWLEADPSSRPLSLGVTAG